MTSVIARHISLSLWSRLGATAPQPGERSQVMTRLEHYNRARDITHGPLRSTDYFRAAHRNHQASASLRFASLMSARARALDANEEEYEVGTTKRSQSRSTCSPAIVAISITVCQWNAPRSDPGIPARLIPRTLGYSSTSTTLARLHARQPLSTF